MAEAIAKGREALSQRVEITQDKVLRELALVGFWNMEDYMKPGEDGEAHFDFFSLTRDQAAAVVDVTIDDKGGVKFKLADKRAALVDIAKHLGMFTDKLQVSGVIGIERWEQLSETEKQQRVASELLQLMGPERANGDDER